MDPWSRKVPGVAGSQDRRASPFGNRPMTRGGIARMEAHRMAP